MVNTEAERQFYLSMAGVRLWYARSELPGAAPSPGFVFPEAPASAPPEVTASPAASVPARKPRPSPASAHHLTGLKAMMSEGQSSEGHPERSQPRGKAPPAPEMLTPKAEDASPVAPVVGEPVASDEQVAIPGRAPGDVPQLSLGFWLGDHTVLASETSGSASARLLDALAENILRALEDSLRDYRTLDWPVFGNPGVAGNDPRHLQDCLQQVSRDFGDRLVVLLGVSADDEAWVADGLGNPRVVFSHGLGELAATPERKRELWASLKHLARR